MKLFWHLYIRIFSYLFWEFPILLVKLFGNKEFILSTIFLLANCKIAFCQSNLIDSANSSIWPQFIQGDTTKFRRTNSGVFTNSSNTLKHQFQLNLNNTQFKTAQFEIDINSAINLSSSNYVEFGFTDSSQLKLQFRLGNVSDQFQILKNDTLIDKGKENEFNVSQFHYRFKLNIRLDTLFVTSINLNKSEINIDTIYLDFYFQKLNAYLKIQQFGSVAIGKLNYTYLYFGKIKIDNYCPPTTLLKQLDNYSLNIEFNKPIQKLIKSQCSITNCTIDSVVPNSNKLYTIQFRNDKKIKRDTLLIEIKNIIDLYANHSFSVKLKFEYTYLDTPIWGDVILSEIMTNPSPSRGILPEKKYIEIFNKSSKYLNSKTMAISDSKSTAKLPAYILEPNKYYLCINENDSGFFSKSQTLKIKSFPNFNIENDLIQMKNANNELLFQFKYNQKMHHPDYSNGGYSLEKTNVNLGTLETNNWQSNSNIGGTLGTKTNNDTHIQIRPFQVIESYFKNDTLTIKFNQNTNPNKIGKVIISGQTDTITLKYFQNLAKGYCKAPMRNSAKIIPILLENALDQSMNNSFMSYNSSFSHSNINFNEILFHNIPYKPDFFEIINNDTSAVFFENTNIKIYDENFQNLKLILPLKNESRELISPNEILAFTNNSSLLITQFSNSNKENMIDCDGFPNLSSEGGSLLLMNIKNGLSIDKITFNDNMHSPNIANPIGVSLEKINPKAESFDSRNWQSAIENNGGATPGLQNSVYTNGIVNKITKHFNIPQKRIINHSATPSPLFIDFQFPEPGYICNAVIYNKFGQLIYESIKNQRLTQQGRLTIWPKKEDQILPNENYIIKLEAFFPNGDLCREIHRFTILNQ